LPLVKKTVKPFKAFGILGAGRDSPCPNVERKTVMALITKLRNSLFLALAILALSPLAGPAAGVFGVEAAQAQTINRIDVTGNSRVDDATVISYLTVRVGDTLHSADIASSTNALLSTGLFSSASITMAGNTLRVKVAENAIVGSVLFEGNQKFSDSQLLDMVNMASSGVYTDERLQTDIQTIKLAYKNAGFEDVAVTARTETDDNGRIRVTFVLNEGQRAGIASISFSGNTVFDSNTLRSIISTKESSWLSWLFRDDTYDQDRLNVDGETIRQYYANHGYPDAQIQSAVGEFDASRNAYFVNFTISEGERYTFGDIGIETSISGLDTEALKSKVSTFNGSRYSAAKLQQTAQEIAVGATDQGFAFADVRPRIDRDIGAHKFNITYLVDEGARIYVERINITGNNKTRDFVIRRELNFAEGDPFNRTLVARGKANIEKLGFFKTVNITTAQGSAPDKIVININVDEAVTGDYGATVGYDSNDGVLGEVSLTERNFLGRGQYLKVALGATQNGHTYDLSFTEPRFMGLKVATGFDVYQHITNENANTFYGTTATGGRVRINVPLTNEINAGIFAGIEQKKFADVDVPNSVLVTDGEMRNSASIGYQLSYSTLDDQRRPHEGFFASLRQEYDGWDNNYINTVLRARYFMPLLEDQKIIASLKGQVGVISDLSGAGVNPTESYMLGPQLVRGFKARGLGPRDATGEALGATFYAGISAEVEFPIPVLPENYGLRGAVWADAGYIGDVSSASPVAPSLGIDQNLRASVGASLIWDSPFGPLRGDFAQVLQQSTGDQTQLFTLTLSTLF